GLISLLVGLFGRVGNGYAAGVGVLDDDAGAVGQGAHALPGGVGVGDVVVGQFFALQLAHAAQQARLHGLVDIESRGLVGVFSVAQGLLLPDLQRERARPFVADGDGLLYGLGVGQAGQVGRDGAVVAGGVGVDLG